jgi:ferrochelatase
MKTGVLLINLGTPDSPSTSDVRKYLREFLNDPRVIDISFLSRLLLVNLIIVPFRAPKSAKLYEKIWSNEGSPLLKHSLSVKEKLQKELGENYVVELGMRYQSPSLSSALTQLKKYSSERIILLPLYPQYASSSTGSSIEKALNIIKKWEVIPSTKIISKFYDRPDFIDAWINIAKKYDINNYDHILFSYHGLPERQIKKASANYGKNYCQLGECCNKISSSNQYCYRAASFETTRQIVKKLNIPETKYSISFQSRLGKTPWIKPYSDEIIIEKARQGIKKMLVFSPAFVADCLETLYEIKIEYNELFRKHGGEKIELVESLNDHPAWIETLRNIILGNP